MLVRAEGIEPTSVGLKGRCNPILLHPLVELTGFEPAPSCLKDRRPSYSLQLLEPREGFEPSFPPYQGGGLPLTYLGLFCLSIGVISRLLYLYPYLSSYHGRCWTTRRGYAAVNRFPFSHGLRASWVAAGSVPRYPVVAVGIISPVSFPTARLIRDGYVVQPTGGLSSRATW